MIILHVFRLIKSRTIENISVLSELDNVKRYNGKWHQWFNPRKGIHVNHGGMNHEANVLAYDDWVENLQQWRMELDKWSGELFNK